MKLWKELSDGKPFCIKGIQSVSDARKAASYGFDGIVVSNHAGRQIDGAVASLDALEQIVNAIGDDIYIMYDSGVRSASDVFKALALGAKFVFVGRLWVWGLSLSWAKRACGMSCGVYLPIGTFCSMLRGSRTWARLIGWRLRVDLKIIHCSRERPSYSMEFQENMMSKVYPFV